MPNCLPTSPGWGIVISFPQTADCREGVSLTGGRDDRHPNEGTTRDRPPVLGVDECRPPADRCESMVSMILGTTCFDCHGCIGTAEIRLNPTGRDQPQRARPTAVACCGSCARGD